MLIGIIGSLESGATLADVVAGLETKYKNAPEILDTLDMASSWIRARQDALQF